MVGVCVTVQSCSLGALHAFSSLEVKGAGNCQVLARRHLLAPLAVSSASLPPWAEGLDCRLQEHSWFVDCCLLAPVRVWAELKLPQAEACY